METACGLEKFTETLQNAGFVQVEVIVWWRWFDRALACNPGTSTPPGAQTLAGMLKCPGCGNVSISKRETDFHCTHCGRKIPISPAGIGLS